MSNLVPVGCFCPNPECADDGITAGQHIIGYGNPKAGRPPFQCKTGQKTFNERKGTLFYQRKTEEKAILEWLALGAAGSRISSISRAKGIKEATIRSFLRQAADPAEQIEASLLNDYRIGQAEMEGLWT